MLQIGRFSLPGRGEEGQLLPKRKLVDGEGGTRAVESWWLGFGEEPDQLGNPASLTVRAEYSPQVWRAAWKTQWSQCSVGTAVGGPRRVLRPRTWERGGAQPRGS